MEYRMSEAFEAAKKNGSERPSDPTRKIRIVLKWPKEIPPSSFTRNEHGIPWPIVNGCYPSWSDCEFFIDGQPVTNVRRVKIDLEAGTDVPIALVEFIGCELDIEAAVAPSEAVRDAMRLVSSLLEDARIYTPEELGRRVHEKRGELAAIVARLSRESAR